MRRKDREVTDLIAIQEIIRHCHVCRLGMIDEQGVHIVPMNFGYSYKNDRHIFYFHSAKVGRKIDAITANPVVSFEMDTNHQLVAPADLCQYTYQFQSIMGTGRVTFLEQPEEKRMALWKIAQQVSPLPPAQIAEMAIPDQALAPCCVFQLTAETLSTKWLK